jgi:L-malate glycosyltransferase
MRIHQICARLKFGDAITNQVMSIHEAATSWGWESHIYSTAHDDVMEKVNEGLPEYHKHYRRNRDDLLVYHHSIYDENHVFYDDSRNRRVFYYHNITPPEFFAPYDAFMADYCRRGRDLIPDFRNCDFAISDSEFNREELLEAGFDADRTGVVPIIVDTGEMGGEYNHELVEELSDGKVNVLFVGRIVPNKRVEDVVDIFAHYHHGINAHSRLFLVGTTLLMGYNRVIAQSISDRKLQGKAIMPGWPAGVSDADLRAYYRAARVFITCSLHEGFCVPLLESMYFGVPVLARDSSAIPYTLGGAGICFRELDPPVVAEALGELATNDALRSTLAARGRDRLEDFRPQHALQSLREYLSRFE